MSIVISCSRGKLIDRSIPLNNPFYVKPCAVVKSWLMYLQQTTRFYAIKFVAGTFTIHKNYVICYSIIRCRLFSRFTDRIPVPHLSQEILNKSIFIPLKDQRHSFCLPGRIELKTPLRWCKDKIKGKKETRGFWIETRFEALFFDIHTWTHAILK